MDIHEVILFSSDVQLLPLLNCLFYVHSFEKTNIFLYFIFCCKQTTGCTYTCARLQFQGKLFFRTSANPLFPFILSTFFRVSGNKYSEINKNTFLVLNFKFRSPEFPERLRKQFPFVSVSGSESKRPQSHLSRSTRDGKNRNK